MKILIGVVIAFAIIVLLIKKVFSSKSLDSIVLEKNVDILSMRDVVEFFKQDLIAEKLSNNKNLLAVAIKENNTVICTLFDEEKNEVASIKDCAIRFKFREIAEDFESLFGDKNMVVLK